jgi:PAS domain S-box-containing protein
MSGSHSEVDFLFWSVCKEGFHVSPYACTKDIAVIVMSNEPSYNKLEQRVRELEAETAKRKAVEEKWLLFMESATDGFALYDSELHLLEVNDALVVRFLPEGVKKEALIGKHITEFAPDTNKTYYNAFRKVLKTGEPLSMDDYVPPAEYSKKGSRANIQAFKVGDGLGVIMTDITERKRAEEELIKRETELEVKNINLEEANIALKVLLKKRDKDREELEEKVMFNLKQLAEPVLEKLKATELDPNQTAYLNVLESNLNEIVSPFPYGLSSRYLSLTPTEIQVANLVRRGESTKEIAELLNSTPRAIDFHRNNIREKLGLKHKKTNLRSYLLTLP